MNMVVGAALTGTAIPAVAASNPDAEVIAAGQKFEDLFSRYMPAWLKWARLHREAKAETEAKFGKGYHRVAWQHPTPGKSPGQKYLSEALARNGASQASDAIEVLYDEMEPLAEFIRETDIESMEGLRAKALVAMWDSRPTGATHSVYLNFEDEQSLCSLLTGAIAATGLSDLFGSFIEQIEAEATKEIAA